MSSMSICGTQRSRSAATLRSISSRGLYDWKTKEFSLLGVGGLFTSISLEGAYNGVPINLVVYMLQSASEGVISYVLFVFVPSLAMRMRSVSGRVIMDN